MTSPVSFADEWARLLPDLTRWVLRRGEDAETAADVCQEAALHAYRRHTRRPFTSRRELRRYAWLVASHRLANLWLRRARHEAPGPVPNLVAPDDVQAGVEHRLDVGETVAALSALAPYQRKALLGEVRHRLPPNATAAALMSLPAAQRAALLAEVEATEAERAVNAFAVARKKARARLREIVNGLPALIRWIRGWSFEDAQRIAAAGLVAMSLLLGLDALWRHRPPRPPVPPPPQSLTRATAPAPTPSAEPRPRAAPPLDAPERRSNPPEGQKTAGQKDKLKVTDPTGHWLRAGFEPNSPDKPLLCVATAFTPSFCLAKPINLSG